MTRREHAANEPPSEDEFDEDERPRRWSEGALRETIRKAVEKGIDAGIGTVSRADKLPREIVSLLFSQIDETKNALVRGVAKEVRDFLEATDIAQEFKHALTTLSFEVKTEIRFIPNDAGDVRAKVRSSARPKRKKRKRAKRKSEAPAALESPLTQAPSSSTAADE